MAEVQSAWGRYPGYRIDLLPLGGRARAWHGDVLLAESDRCLRVEETDHVDRLYFPRSDVRLELFTATDHHTVCPFKGRADYWTLSAADPPEENVLWGYPIPFPEVAGLEDHVAFYHERVRVEVEQTWPGSGADGTVNRFPLWGDARDLLGLLDVQPLGGNRFQGPPFRVRTRNVVEGGQQVAQAVVAASRAVPDQRVTSASMIFAKAATFDVPIDVEVEPLRRGRSFSTVAARLLQDGQLRSAGLLLMDAGAPDVFTHQAAMPDVAGPEESPPLDMGVSGRQIRVVDGAYSPDPDRVGPPEIHAWVRFRDAPPEPCLHAALAVQSTTHWGIAAAMRPHPGFGEAQAHTSLSTAPMSIAVALHADIDVTQWLLYSNTSTHAGRGLAQSDGKVFTADGRLVASYTVQAMIRAFARDPSSLPDPGTAM